MSLFSTFMKWKMRWAVLSGVFTLIVLPIARLVFRRKKPVSSSQQPGQVIDVKAEDISKVSEK